MSCLRTIQAEVRDMEIVKAACARLGWVQPESPYAKDQYQLRTTDNWLSGNLATGEVRYDEDYPELEADSDAFLQAYAVEAALAQARANGYTVHETKTADNAILLRVAVGGGV